jgi:histidinol dehydrogenase
VRVRRIELASDAPGQARALARTIRSLAAKPPDVGTAVAEIVAAVRERGDDAVVELTRRFDTELAPDELRVPAPKLQAALESLDPELREALETAIANVRKLSEAEITRDVSVELPQGQRVELRELAVRRAGVYVPGGRAAYPSTAVMCCVPARVAGVAELAVATPPGPGGEPSAIVLAACALCEVEEVYLMGGAQAIAALAFGTATVEPVDVVVGPGNHYVQEAKRQLVGVVQIDGIAGPTELVVIAGQDADARLVALDLAAQAEHGDDTLLVLLSSSERLLNEVEVSYAELARSNGTVSEAPLALVRVPSLEAAVGLANAIAPEHLELASADASELADRVRASGCVFIGAYGGAAFGDYAAGSNHVLPTGGAARFASPLGVGRFRRRQALVSLPERAARALAPHVSSLARAEGFPLHAESAEARDRLSTRERQ